MTYTGLAEQLDVTGKSLNAFGFGRSDRIAIVLAPGAISAACTLTVSACATVVPLNPRYTREEFDSYLEQVAPSALIVRAEDATPARGAAGRLGIPVVELAPNTDRGAGSFDLRADRSPRPRTLGAATAEDIGLVILTSGSTSRPKLVALDHKTLIHRAWKHARWVGLEANDRGLLFMPLFHGQGINAGLYPPILVGGCVIAVPDFDADGFFRLLREFEPTWFTAGPTHLRAILGRASEDRAVFRPGHIRFIRTGSGHLSASVMEMLQQAFGAPVIETYNTSETGQLAGGLLSWTKAENGVSPMAASEDVAIIGEDGTLLEHGEIGEIVARGDTVFTHYLNDDYLTADAFRDGWFRTGDLGSIDQNGFLMIKGRIKEIINHGGEKISPEEIESVLEAHPEVKVAVSFAIPHPSLGEQVVAAVVLHVGATATEADLKQHTRARLAHFKVPRKIALVDAIPVGPTGKVLRDEVVTRLKTLEWFADDRSAPMRGPTTPLEATLIDLWRRQLRRNDIGIDDDFFLLGGDSLQAIELFLHIEEHLGKILPRSILLEAATIGEMARLIEADRSSESLVPINPAGSLPPLYCVHDGSGQVLLFRHLSRHLGGEQPLYGLQARGIDGKTPFHMSIEEMAADYVEAIRGHQPKGPYYLAGYSFGGKVALEMAHQLQAAGERVALLALFDSYLRGPRSRVSIVTWLRRHMKRFAELQPGAYLPYLKDRIRHAAKIVNGFVRRRAVDRALERNARGQAVSPELSWDVAAYASRRYRPPVIDCKAVLFRAQLYAWAHPNVHTGWNALVKNGVEMVQVPGHHFDLLEEPHVREVAAELRQRLRRARDISPSAKGD